MASWLMVRLFVLLLPALAACATSRQNWGKHVPGLPEDLWADAPTGSWVRQKQILRYGDFEQVWEGLFRRGTAGVEADPPKIVDMRAAPFDYFPAPATHGAFERSRRSGGRETLHIGDRAFPCDVIDVELAWPHTCAWSEGLIPHVVTRLRLWICPDAPTPQGVLKWIAEDPFRRSDFAYTKVDERTEINARFIHIREVRYTGRRRDGGSIESIAMVWSDDVPGRQVRYLREVSPGTDEREQKDEVVTLDWG
ncbi:MAG: hypothetical protein ACRD1B_00360, partial [Thermoanaerobaculia bacterium]